MSWIDRIARLGLGATAYALTYILWVEGFRALFVNPVISGFAALVLWVVVAITGVFVFMAGTVLLVAGEKQ